MVLVHNFYLMTVPNYQRNFIMIFWTTNNKKDWSLLGKKTYWVTCKFQSDTSCYLLAHNTSHELSSTGSHILAYTYDTDVLKLLVVYTPLIWDKLCGSVLIWRSCYVVFDQWYCKICLKWKIQNFPIFSRVFWLFQVFLTIAKADSGTLR